MWDDYTKRMFLGNNSKIWSYFNNQRLVITFKQVKKYHNSGTYLDVGAYDGFIIYKLLKQNYLKKVDSIHLLDMYDDKKNRLKNTIEYNLKVFKNKYNTISFEIISSTAEDLSYISKFNNISVFETLEHVEDEKKSIANLHRALKKNGALFVSYPVEFGVLFFIKDLGRRFILRKDYHSFKELFYGLIGRVDKIKRKPRAHKGYDFRKTLKLCEREGFEVIENRFYPLNSKCFAYGGCCVLVKK